MTNIQFPYVSVVTPLPLEAALAPGSALTALVEQVLPDSRYRISVKGLVLEATLPYLLQPQDQVRILVRDVTPTNILIDVSPVKLEPPPVIADAQISDLLDRLHLPPREDSVRLVREFLRQRAPIERETLATAIESARGRASRMQAAAFLASRGVEPTEEAVDLLSRLTRPPSPPGPPAEESPLLRAVQAALQPAPEIEPALQSAFGPSPLRAIDRVLSEVLEANPRLRAVDRALEVVEKAVPAVRKGETPPPPLEVARRVAALLKEILDGKFPSGPLRESPEVLRELRLRLLETERLEIRTDPRLARAREASGSIFEALDRVQGYRMVNQLLALRDESAALVEIPVTASGKRFTVPVRIMRRREGGPTAEAGVTLLTIDTDLTRLGRVRTRMEARKKSLVLRFQVRDDDVRACLEEGAPGLMEALGDAGFEASVRVGVERVPEDPLHFPTTGDTAYTVIDVRA